MKATTQDKLNYVNKEILKVILDDQNAKTRLDVVTAMNKMMKLQTRKTELEHELTF